MNGALRCLLRNCILFACATAVAGGKVQAQIVFGASKSFESPDGRIIGVNGVLIVSQDNGLGWFYDWGDGQQTTAFFPTLHRYTSSRPYEITLTAYTKLNQHANAAFTHLVPATTSASVARVELSDYVVGLKAGESCRFAGKTSQGFAGENQPPLR